ncbi:MAG: MFS transporter [Bacteroidaceae bacterium]|nr:MFS transporter [Bacteroidaceae bacterium]
MTQKKTSALGPFIILTFIYFIVGFLTTVNEQCEAPLKTAFLSDVAGLKNTLITLITFFFFLAYLLVSPLGGKWIERHGYKSTLVRALLVMVGGLAMCFLSSVLAIYFEQGHVTLGDGNHIPYGYFVFLIGSFLLGASAALLQVVINPYINAYDLPGTTPLQRMNTVTGINSFGTFIAPVFVPVVMFGGVAMSQVRSSQLQIPFLALTVCMSVITWITHRLQLPDIEGTHAGGEEKLERSVWSFRHLTLGIVAIFFYVGTEVGVGTNVTLHAHELIAEGFSLSFLGRESLSVFGVPFDTFFILASLYWGGMMVGRMVFSRFNGIAPRPLLAWTTVGASALILLAMLTNNLWVLISVGLCHSVMWSCIFTLAVKGLGKYTSKASSMFMMGVFGGAVFPLLQAWLADACGGWRWTWFIMIGCELVMLAYALWGSRVTDPWCRKQLGEAD